MPYSVSLQLKRFTPGSNPADDDGGMWGIDGGVPTYVVRNLTVTFGETRVVIYRKLLTDLCCVDSAAVRASSKGQSNELVLSLSGGDAAGSFEGEFHFKDCRLTERVIRMGELPEHVWERLELHQLEVGGCGRTSG
jgi:hypothetical protein